MEILSNLCGRKVRQKWSSEEQVYEIVAVYFYEGKLWAVGLHGDKDSNAGCLQCTVDCLILVEQSDG